MDTAVVRSSRRRSHLRLVGPALAACLLALPLLGPGELQCHPIPVDPPRDTRCDDGGPLVCDQVEPECPAGQLAAIRGGCWVCVDRETCAPSRDERCDDGTEPLCLMPVPLCEEGELLAVRNHCYVCVNPATCQPWGEPGCRADATCGVAEWCDPCGTSSCPGCDDCVPACAPHGCATEAEPLCDAIRPECGQGRVAVVRGGCWVCVSLETCEPVREGRCDDGTPLLCDMVEPACGFGEVAAVRDGCWVCVNAVTCRPWGEAGCRVDADCPAAEYCSECATGSCPVCLDCVAGCTPHGCPTEPEPDCRMVRPECEDGGVAVVRDGCWVCVGFDACAPLGQ